MTKAPTLTEADLSQFTGSEKWYQHSFNRQVTFTDGAKYVADQGGAYWLLDEIVLAQRFVAHVAAEVFQVWKLTVHSDHTAVLTCEDGNANIVLVKPLAYTDFPLREVTLYFTNNVIYLPSEH